MMMQLNSRVLFYIQWKCAVDLLLLCAHLREVIWSPVFTLEIKKEKKIKIFHKTSYISTLCEM